MPIAITSNKYNASLTGALPISFYQSNAGDTAIQLFTVVEEIGVASGLNVLNYNAAQNTIIWGNGNFLTEGFLIGDDCEVIIYNSAGTQISTQSITLVAVNSTSIIHNGAPITWYDQLAGQTIEILVDSKGGTAKRNGLILDINHVPNTAQGTEFSLIDGEVTRFIFDLTGTVFNQLVQGQQVGLKSGQFYCLANCKDKTNYTTSPLRRTYEIIIATIQSGVYDSSYFQFSNCLKLYTKQSWQRDFGNPNNMLQYVISDQANTGWFDEAFNTGVINSALVQGINELDYSVPTSGQISVDYAGALFFFGGCYIPTDENYYKSQPYNQSELGMIATTQGNNVYPLTINNGYNNPNGAGWQLQLSNPTTVGTVTTFDFTFTPNSQFATFMDSRTEGDRLFRLWVKAGNVNWLLFDNQLIKEPAKGEPLNLIVKDFVDHSENIISTTINQSGFKGNIEDDLAFIGKIMIPNNSIIDNIKGSVEAYNSVTNESFVLQTVLFDFSAVPIVGGMYPINQNQEIFTILQNTNAKRYANLFRDSLLDSASEYCLSIHVPIIYRWEYWLSQPNAAADFYPNEQTKNWFNYENFTDWDIRFKLDGIINGLTQSFEEQIIIMDYDSDKNVDQTIELIRDLDNTVVTVIIENELMRIRATHELTNSNYQWLTPSVWGIITCEPFENAPRYDCSTVIPYDNNPINPLKPISGTLCSLTFPAPNIAEMECYFDSSKINLENGVKFTTKIKGCVISTMKNFKLLTNGQVKLTTDGLPKLIS